MSPGRNGTARPRLAYVVKMFPRFSETFILNELLELESRGFEVAVYSLKRATLGPVHPQLERLRARRVVLPERPHQWLTRGAAAAAVVLARRPGPTLRTLLYVLTRRTHQAWKRFFQACVLVRDLERHEVDRLHAHFASAPTRVAWFVSRLTGIPFSFTAHAKDIYQEGTDLDLLRDKIAAAQFVVTVSDYNRDYLIRVSGAPGRIRRLYNGVDTSRFAPREGPRTPRVVAVGRLVEKKGFDVLLRAWPAVVAAHPQARLVMIGDGPERETLRELARSLGIERSIEWTGPQPQERVSEWLGRATVFCLPCRVARDGNRDGLPTVLLEAMAAGVPCVTTPVTAIPEIVRDGGEGRLVPPESPEVLSEALIELLSARDRRDSFGRNARERAAALFDLRRNVSVLADWFSEA